MLGYISTSISDGPGCLMLRCPDPTCGAAVGQDMISLLKSDEDKQKYARYLLRSYIEDNKKVCPRYGIMKLIVIVKGIFAFSFVPPFHSTMFSMFYFHNMFTIVSMLNKVFDVFMLF